MRLLKKITNLRSQDITIQLGLSRNLVIVIFRISIFNFFLCQIFMNIGSVVNKILKNSTTRLHSGLHMEQVTRLVCYTFSTRVNIA